jgi:hypothetical protein
MAKQNEDVTDMFVGTGVEKGIANLNTILLEQNKKSIDSVEHLLDICQFKTRAITGSLTVFGEDPEGTPINTAAAYDTASKSVLKIKKPSRKGYETSKLHIVDQAQAFSILEPTIKRFNTNLVSQGSQHGVDWLCLEVPELKQGDTPENKQDMYLVATLNGGLQTKVCWTPVRTACSNTLNLAFSKAGNAWQIQAQKYLYQEAACRVLADRIADPGIYIDAQAKKFEELKTIKVSGKRLEDFVEYMFPASLPERFEPDRKAALEIRRQAFRDAWEDETAEDYGDTAYGMVMAMSWYRSRVKLSSIKEGSIVSYVQQRLAGHDSFIGKGMRYIHYCV